MAMTDWTLKVLAEVSFFFFKESYPFFFFLNRRATVNRV